MKATKNLWLLILTLVSFSVFSAGASDNNADSTKLRIGIVGLTHTHVHWLLGREKIGDIEIVGIVEKNKALAKRYAEQYGLSMDIVFDSMEEMIAKTNPIAVAAFGSIYEHLAVVQIAAPRGIHVMVEKPLAVSVDHAKKMQKLAEKYNISLLTNYETTYMRLTP